MFGKKRGGAFESSNNKGMFAAASITKDVKQVLVIVKVLILLYHTTWTQAFFQKDQDLKNWEIA